MRWRTFDSAKPLTNVLPELGHKVPSLLKDDEASPERRNTAADLMVRRRHEREVSDGVLPVGVESEGHHHDRSAESRDALEPSVERREVRGIVASSGERDVQVRPCAGPGAFLIGVAGEVGIRAVRVAVE